MQTDEDGRIVLIPQPSIDPNEPLVSAVLFHLSCLMLVLNPCPQNWPAYQKVLIFGIANMFTLMVYATYVMGHPFRWMTGC